MSNTVIRVENVSKQYRLGKIGTGSFAHDVNRWWHNMRGKEDPYLKVGEENDRTKKGNSEYVWALRDVSFDVQKGDVIGIVGKNGAGKSTLLKLLSRTTLPTIGSIKLKGRIVSLLEVGTGFHPELTGKENIFLNGAILGMTKSEIKKKFDEIVDFSGVGKYIDTPVKRYSSGMYVRLAFAVAAHLDPEILIVDEVLAVGDAEFQKKAIGKMKDVSKGEGRTVLFVSHNIGALKSLCLTGILLENGIMKFQGNMEDTLANYLEQKNELENKSFLEWFDFDSAPGDKDLKIISMGIGDSRGVFKNQFTSSEEIKLNVKFVVKEKIKGGRFIIQLSTSSGEIAFASTNHGIMSHYLDTGIYETTCTVPANLLNAGRYYIRIHAGIPNQKYIVQPKEFFFVDILASGHHGSFLDEKWPGVVAPGLTWTLKKEE